jgi:hypothetical protein
MQKFRDVLSRWEHKELSAMEAGELLGCSERQFRRYRPRYEEEGLEGLVDRRLGKASFGWDRLAHLSDELDRALVETDHRPLAIGRGRTSLACPN